MSDSASAEPGAAGGPRPRRGEDVVLHEVPSDLEGTRFVLKSGAGAFLELPRGAADAFVWARLDGQTALEAIARAYLEEHGSLHPDLGALVELLRGEGMLDEPVPVTARREGAGARVTRLAGRLAMIRIPVPLSQPLWRMVGRLAAPLYARPLGLLAGLVALVGLALALGPTDALGVRAGSLLAWPLAGGPSLLAGLGVLLLLNMVVDLFEAVAQVAILARGKRAPGRIGLSFDLGIPGIYIETPDALLLPLERRLWLMLCPLLAAGFLGGLASAAYFLLPQRVPELDPTLLIVLHKLAWVAWLRAAIHLNPLTPSPLYDALCAWVDAPHLRRQAWRLLRGHPLGIGGEQRSRREGAVRLYLGLVIGYLVFVARLGTHLLSNEVLPQWRAAEAAGDLVQLRTLVVLILVLGLPTLLGVVGGLLFCLQAGARALSESGIFATPANQAGALGGVVLLGAFAPRLIPVLEPQHLVHVFLLAGVLVSALLTVAAGARLGREAGLGWGALAGPALGGAAALHGAAWGMVLFHGQVATYSYGPEALLHLAAPSGAGLVFLGGLAAYAWALLETYRGGSPREGLDLRDLAIVLPPMAAAALCFLGERQGLVRPLLYGGMGLTGLAALLGLLAWLRTGSGARGAGLALIVAGLTGSAAVWTLGWGRDTTAIAFLGAGLIAGGSWCLVRAAAASFRLPEFRRALSGETPEAQAGAACAFVQEGLYEGVRARFGPGLIGALRQVLAAEGVSLHDVPGELVQVTGQASPQAQRMGLIAGHRLIAERCGSAFARDVLERVVARLPARAHERLAASGSVSLLSPLGRMGEVPGPRRLALLRRVVQFTDFDEDALQQLADWVGLMEVAAGEVIIRQGELGERFYLLAKGRARVLVEDATGNERAVAALHAGDAFGESVLLSHEPRSASVVAETPALLLTLDRELFARFMQDHKALLPALFARQEDLSLVREVPLFADLSGEQVAALCRRLVATQVSAGEAVIRQGEAGDRFYLIREGRLEVRHTVEGEERVEATLGRGEYFGEIALLEGIPRTASVVAVRESELLALGREDFRALLMSGAGRALAQRSQRRLDALRDSVSDLALSDEAGGAR